MTDNTDDATLHKMTLSREPHFEPGKSYRTRGGKTAYVIDEHRTGNLPFRMNVRGEIAWAHRDGSFQFYGQPDQLLPGAIEYENRTAEGIAAGQDDGRTAMKQSHGYRIALLEGKEAVRTTCDPIIHEDIEMRLAELEKHRANHGERLINLQDRITETEREADHFRDRILALEARPTVPDLTDAVAGLDNTMKHITTMQQSLIRLMGWARERDPSFDARIARPLPKRTIKGGWVNVYRYEKSPVLHISPIIFARRAECDAEGTNYRIACIQIPDITEGEGL